LGYECGNAGAREEAGEAHHGTEPHCDQHVGASASGGTIRSDHGRRSETQQKVDAPPTGGSGSISRTVPLCDGLGRSTSPSRSRRWVTVRLAHHRRDRRSRR
jgi:hypothetical protein